MCNIKQFYDKTFVLRKLPYDVIRLSSGLSMWQKLSHWGYVHVKLSHWGYVMFLPNCNVEDMKICTKQQCKKLWEKTLS